MYRTHKSYDDTCITIYYANNDKGWCSNIFEKKTLFYEAVWIIFKNTPASHSTPMCTRSGYTIVFIYLSSSPRQYVYLSTSFMNVYSHILACFIVMRFLGGNSVSSNLIIRVWRTRDRLKKRPRLTRLFTKIKQTSTPYI